MTGPDSTTAMVTALVRLRGALQEARLPLELPGAQEQRAARTEMVEHKVGQRHVQGRTKAGGQSQQRFARRRDNQARQAYEAAADHAARILGGVPVASTGGDHVAVDAVLTDPRLVALTVVEPWLAVPDPRRAVLDAAIADTQAIRVDVTNA